MGTLDSLQTFFNKVGGLITAADAFTNRGHYPMTGYGMYGPSIWTAGGCFGGQYQVPQGAMWDQALNGGGYAGSYGGYSQYGMGNGSQACMQLQQEIDAAIDNAGKSLTGSQDIAAGQATQGTQGAQGTSQQNEAAATQNEELSDTQKSGLEALKTGQEATIADNANDPAKYNQSVLNFAKGLIKSMNNNSANAEGLTKAQFTELYKSYMKDAGKTDAQLTADSEKAFELLNKADNNEELDAKEVAVFLAALDAKDGGQTVDGKIQQAGAKSTLEQLAQANDDIDNFINELTTKLFDSEDQA